MNTLVDSALTFNRDCPLDENIRKNHFVASLSNYELPFNKPSAKENLANRQSGFKTSSFKSSERVTLLGLDFGSTTSSALVASAAVCSNGANGRLELSEIKIEYRCEPVLTPFLEQSIDIEKISQLINTWLIQSNLNISKVFSGGSMITGLAAQADNAKALSQLITSITGDSVIATANDPCLESWLAFMGSCSALSRYHADLPILNFDIGGGTTNVALGLSGNVLETGCYFIGARHFQFVPGNYQITALSCYAKALLDTLNIHKGIGAILNAKERTKIITFYVNALEAIASGANDFFKLSIAKKHCQVAISLTLITQSSITFSGGVGELIYQYATDNSLPSTTFFGDFGVDLAKAIVNSPILSGSLKTCVPEHKGRATVVGLTLHSTEISGSTIYLPNPEYLPLRDLPIIAKLELNTTSTQWHNALVLAAKRQHGACIQIIALNIDTSNQVKLLAQNIKNGLAASQYPKHQPLVILIQTNIGKALGNYVSEWGQSECNLIVIDEVALRNAHFVHIGCLHQQMIPVSFFGIL